jgi:hypothetical protein
MKSIVGSAPAEQKLCADPSFIAGSQLIDRDSLRRDLNSLTLGMVTGSSFHNFVEAALRVEAETGLNTQQIRLLIASRALRIPT